MGRPALPPHAAAIGEDGENFVPAPPPPPAPGLASFDALAATDAAVAAFLAATAALHPLGEPIYAVRTALFNGKLHLVLRPGALDAVPPDAVVAAAANIDDLELVLI
jgi:hypothetical protein